MHRSPPRLLLGAFFSLVLPTLAVADDFKTPAITADALHAREGKPDAPLIVDVRPYGEYKAAHIAGAVDIPYNKMDMHLDELRKAKGVVLYCTQGHRTKLAEKALLEHQVPSVLHLQGGSAPGRRLDTRSTRDGGPEWSCNCDVVGLWAQSHRPHGAEWLCAGHRKCRCSDHRPLVTSSLRIDWHVAVVRAAAGGHRGPVDLPSDAVTPRKSDISPIVDTRHKRRPDGNRELPPC
jgi:rhodanese-related sulfurtransferase